MENGQAIGGISTYLESGNHTTEMTTKTFTELHSFKNCIFVKTPKLTTNKANKDCNV